jgi:GntR family transcriptional regulator
VARTYRELEHGGYVLSRRGGGTRVAPTPPRAATPQRALEEAAQAYLDRARVLGIPAEEAVEVVRSKASGG